MTGYFENIFIQFLSLFLQLINRVEVKTIENLLIKLTNVIFYSSSFYSLIDHIIINFFSCLLTKILEEFPSHCCLVVFRLDQDRLKQNKFWHSARSCVAAIDKAIESAIGSRLIDKHKVVDTNSFSFNYCHQDEISFFSLLFCTFNAKNSSLCFCYPEKISCESSRRSTFYFTNETLRQNKLK